MSIDLSILVYPQTPAYAAIDLFRPVVEAVGAWEPSLDNEWSRFEVRPTRAGAKRPERKRESAAGPLSTARLVELASAVPPRPGLRLTAGVPFRCWRRAAGGAEAGHAGLFVDCWNPDSHPRAAGLLDMNGCGDLWVQRPYALYAGTEVRPADAGEGVTGDNRAAENADALVALMSAVAVAARPRSLKLFVDHGDRLPFNAHCAYYADAAAVAGDVSLIARVWRDGLPGYLSPLGAYDAARHKWAMDERRSPDQRRALWADLDAGMGAADRVTPESVERALARTTLDVLRAGDGFLLLNFPFFLGGFVDRFFVDLLGEA